MTIKKSTHVKWRGMSLIRVPMAKRARVYRHGIEGCGRSFPMHANSRPSRGSGIELAGVGTRTQTPPIYPSKGRWDRHPKAHRYLHVTESAFLVAIRIYVVLGLGKVGGWGMGMGTLGAWK